MKKILSVFLALIMAFGIFCSVPFAESPFKFTVNAASVDDLTFRLNSDKKSYYVYYVYDCKTSASGDLTIPSTYNGLPVTSIGGYAFRGCTSLTSVTIPDSVTSIGGYAFSGCTSLASVTIGNGVTSIGSYAFSGCTSLASVTIPDSVTSIGSYAFYNCTSLTSINVDAENKYYSSLNGVLFNKNKTELIQYPIGKTDTQYTIPDSVTYIGRYAFSGCTSLTSVTIPDSVTSIGDYAFRGCTSLASVTIPDSVTSIGEYAFYGCKSLTSVTIPDSVTSIGEYAFDGCQNLESVYINDLASWLNIKFSNYWGSNPLVYADYLYINGKLATDVVIPDGVTSIPKYGLNCKNIKSIVIPDSVTSIGWGAFYGCENLESVYINDLASWLNIKFSGNPVGGGGVPILLHMPIIYT